MSAVIDGPVHWDMTRDEDGHRNYKLIWQLHTTNPDDGPGQVLICPGLPVIGSTWIFGTDNDPWAYCWPNATIAPIYQKEKCDIWTVEQLFTTRPFKRCADNDVGSPFAEPYRIGGSFNKLTKQGTHDRHGERIQNPAFEPFKGALTEFDDNRPTIEVGKNLMGLPLSTFAPMVDTVNDSDMWGLPKRTIKLCTVRWSRAVYGTCSYYFPVDYGFEVNYNTWDRKIQNDSTKVLKDGGDPDTPEDYILATDKAGNPINVILNEDGTLWDGTGDAPTTDVEYYDEKNFFALDLPTTLEG
jgi:hypothetical protein